ncbi:MAG: methyl-coenzyme M reductase operon protein D [Candidatus Methanoperedens sp.]|nr:methyl-coenzyme M reductase operon protein D [Candidatus Methanoperedens sp.]
MVRTANVSNKLKQVRIFPQRLLLPETAEKLLNEIDSVKGVVRMLISGKNLPRKVTCGPGTGMDVNHPDRVIIQVSGCAFELFVIVGEVLVEVDDESVMEELRKACERALPFPFEMKRGYFIKTKATLTDYGKYGFKSKFDETINLEDERMLGMVDPHAKLETNLCMVKAGENV